MESITQEDVIGCSVACVAFRIRKSYGNVKKLFKHPEYAVSRGYYCRELVKILNKARFHYPFQRVSTKNKSLFK